MLNNNNNNNNNNMIIILLTINRYAELLSLSRIFQETGGLKLPTINFVPNSEKSKLKKKKYR